VFDSPGWKRLVGTAGDRATAAFDQKRREPWETEAIVLAVPPAGKRDHALRVTPVMIPSLVRVSGTGRRKEPEITFQRIVRGPRKGRRKRRQRSVAREHEIPEPEAGQGRGFFPLEASFAVPEPPVVRSFNRPYFVRVGVL